MHCIRLLAISVLFAAAVSPALGELEPPSAPVSATLSSLLFIENVGQFDAGGRFQVRGSGSMIWLANDALWITVVEQQEQGIGYRTSGFGTDAPNLDPRSLSPVSETRNPIPAARKGINLKLSFPGSNPAPVIEPYNRLETHVSYFIGDDAGQWHPDVPVWGGVRYKDLYAGIDLEISGEQGNWAWRLAGKPGADLSRVRLQVEGGDVSLEAGTLRLSTAAGDVALPLMGVAISDGRALSGLPQPQIAGQLVLTPFGSGPPAPRVGLESGAADLLYSTYLGGTAPMADSEEEGLSVTVDNSGNLYLTGFTWSANFPTTPGAYDRTRGGNYDAFVTKLNPSGSALVYSTFLGGSTLDERGSAIAIDPSGKAYIAGSTSSTDFPTTAGAYDRTSNGIWDAFVARINATGSSLQYGTYLGGGASDYGWGIAVDETGKAYVSGLTSSGNFPTTSGAFDTGLDGAADAFVAKLNMAGGGAADLIYGSYLGGSDEEAAARLAMDGNHNVYLTGSTESHNFPTTANAYDTTHNYSGYTHWWDVFVVKMSLAGAGAADLLYGSYLGGTSDENGDGIAVDSNGGIYVTGYTPGAGFPTTAGAYDTVYNEGGDAFVSKLNPAGAGAADLAYSTFLGGDQQDWAHAIYASGNGRIYVTGLTGSTNFPTTTGVFDRTHNGGVDVFVTKLNPAGGGSSDIVYSTFLGGSSTEWGYGITADAKGNAFVTGYTRSGNFPTSSTAFDNTFTGYRDVFVAKMGITAKTTITLTAVADTRLNLNNPTTNYGAVTQISCGMAAGLSKGMPCLFQFDLSSIPAGAVINSAALQLYSTAQTGTGSATFAVYAMKRAWTEMGATWSAYDGTNAWGTAGAQNTTLDREATASATATLTGLPAHWSSITLTNLLKRWLSGGLVNNGLKLQRTGGTLTTIKFRAHEAGNNRPQLVVKYSLP
jgi:hypothetical protein